MSDQLILYERREAAAIITLHRPQKLNALSDELVNQLREALRRAESAEEIRAIILTGAGEAFSAGLDLNELARAVEAQAEAQNALPVEGRLPAEHLIDEIYRLAKPTIAAVNGLAVAGGSGMVCVCDLAVATTTARFGFPQVRLGIAAGVVIPHVLRLLGERAARELLLTGELIDAATALRIGMVGAVVPREQLLDRALAWAGQIAQGRPEAIAATKRLLRRFSAQAGSLTMPEYLASPAASAEMRAGLAAFLRRQRE